MATLPIDKLLVDRCVDTVNAILTAMPTEDHPDRVIYVVPGQEVVWDDNCTGQLTARLSSFLPHRSTNTKTASLTKCSIDYWTASVEITLLRCAQVVDNQGLAPSPTELTADGLRGLYDMRVILEAITLLDFVDDVVTWEPIGPEGGFYGNRWIFTLKVDATPCD